MGCLVFRSVPMVPGKTVSACVLMAYEEFSFFNSSVNPPNEPRDLKRPSEKHCGQLGKKNESSKEDNKWSLAHWPAAF